MPVSETKKTVVKAKALSKIYDGQRVVNAVDFSVWRGEWCGILGTNGAGKTTTLRMLIGNTPPSGGELEVLDLRIPAQARDMRARIGVVPQEDCLDPNFSTEQNLLIYGRYFGLNKALLKQRIPKLL
ncbi:MAG: ATP-binding cassette domain-containing protein, partial [Gammaproteobacteria bacterium]|nr:ATP-binding cassette domain-containing protein [Gammaproteobacteria bacterium]